MIDRIVNKIKESKGNKKGQQPFLCVVALWSGSYWVRTSDPLLVRQML